MGPSRFPYFLTVPVLLMVGGLAGCQGVVDAEERQRWLDHFGHDEWAIVPIVMVDAEGHVLEDEAAGTRLAEFLVDRGVAATTRVVRFAPVSVSHDDPQAVARAVAHDRWHEGLQDEVLLYSWIRETDGDPVIGWCVIHDRRVAEVVEVGPCPRFDSTGEPGVIDGLLVELETRWLGGDSQVESTARVE